MSKNKIINILTNIISNDTRHEKMLMEKIKEIAREKEFSEGELSRWRNDPQWWKWPIQPTRKQREKIWKENGVEPTMYDYEGDE